MEERQASTRVRINLSQSAKGAVQFDVTAEAETPEQARAYLAEAVDNARALIKEKGLVEAGAVG